ncbi:MFS general substrate transporter [Rhypophila decipiens]
MENTEKQDRAGEWSLPDSESLPAEGRKSPDPPAPDGGLKAWLQVLGCWCLVFNTMGSVVTFGIYQAFYERGTIFSESAVNIAWIGSTQALMMFLCGGLAGALYDRGYLKLLLIMGGLGIVLGHMLLSLCTQFWQVLMAQGLLIGIGGGCLFVPALTVAQPYFQDRLGLALGVIGTGSSVGSAIYAITFINLIDQVGFGWTTRVLGFILLVVMVIPIAVLEKRVKSPGPQSKEKPPASALFDGPYVLCILGCFLGYAGVQVSFFYTAYYGESNEWLTGNVALYLVVIINAGAIVGRVVPNWLADKIGPMNVAVPGSLLIAVVLLCNLAVSNRAGIICDALFLGFLSGVFISLPPLLFASLTKDPAILGMRMGIAYAIIGLSVLPGGPGAGGVLENHHDGSLDWPRAWTYAGCLLGAAFCVFCVLRVVMGGLRVFVKV